MRDFVEEHWADLIGIFVLILGVSLILLGAYAGGEQTQTVSTTGTSLVLAGMTALGLKNREGKTASKERE